ncbi:HlyD family secretion protein [Aeromonas enteropelogenes]|uniref:HlyD family secretion protein n=1 Tax=Aeromonas enteropelogenes TaxID=29489 RepID=UPI000F52809E|nr:HlyD family secretion protein [Aeromonas enteropelogenes]RQM69040.1 HlyD family secretion protein [Aeromonas enteropelogenes]UAK72866.1 HlyD family secretion protein [Aeromonas enteropelogenes]
MSQDPQPSQPTPSAPPAPAGKGSRVATQLLLALIGLSLLWYFAADRLTPYSSQARVQAFVVPIAAQVSGQVQQVLVKNNDDVAQGQPLFEIDPSQYQIALQRARSDYDSVLRSVNAASAGVTAAEASLQAAKANRLKAEQDANRQERLYAEDPGAISVRRLEVARATRVQAQSQVKAAEASLIQAKEAAGNSGDKNSQLMSARSAIEKAELDLAHTKVLAPSRGLVTDLRTDVGQFVSAGAPAMTLIAIHDVWISADMTENNLGNLKPGDEVAIVLDVMPGQVFKGRIRSLGNGVSAGNQTAAGSLPTVQNNRDWLRQAQRFPVAIEFDKEELARLQGIRVGGQAEVLVYSGDNWLMNGLGALFIRLMSLLSYLY